MLDSRQTARLHLADLGLVLKDFYSMFTLSISAVQQRIRCIVWHPLGIYTYTLLELDNWPL